MVEQEIPTFKVVLVGKLICTLCRPLCVIAPVFLLYVDLSKLIVYEISTQIFSLHLGEEI